MWRWPCPGRASGSTWTTRRRSTAGGSRSADGPAPVAFLSGSPSSPAANRSGFRRDADLDRLGHHLGGELRRLVAGAAVQLVLQLRSQRDVDAAGPGGTDERRVVGAADRHGAEGTRPLEGVLCGG